MFQKNLFQRNMLKKPDGRELLTCALITVWIFAVNLIGPKLTAVPLWPMYFITIFYFGLGGEKKNTMMIFLGAATGLLMAAGLFAAAYALTPFTGSEAAFGVCLLAALGAVIIGGCFCPVLFNNITFAYLTVACLDGNIILEMYGAWLLVLAVGGPIILGGALLCVFAVKKLWRKPTPQTHIFTML